MTVFRLTWTTYDGQHHAGAPRFLTQAAAARAGKLLAGDRSVQAVEVRAVIIRPIGEAVARQVPVA